MGNKYFYEGAWMLAALIATLIALGFATNKVLKQPTVVKAGQPKNAYGLRTNKAKKFHVIRFPLGMPYAGWNSYD